MPVSKHRRKPGGRSAKHPGQAHASRTRRQQADSALLRVAMTPSAFHSKVYEIFQTDDPHAVLYMADLVEGWHDGPVPLAPIVVAKDELFAAFVKPIGPLGPIASQLFEDEPERVRTIEDAEAALALLVEHELVVLNDGRVAMHPRFTHPDAVASRNPT
jgi:hypothetical protein